jgi:hypothetical protein
VRRRLADLGIEPHDVMFLLTGGNVTCLLGSMGWIRSLRTEQKSYS